jgi:hypothetical protein
MFGLLLLGLYGSLTQYACDVYNENCPHEQIKQMQNQRQNISSKVAMVLAPLASVLVLRHEGAFPFTIFLCSLGAVCLAYNFKETSNDSRREALRMTHILRPDIRMQI